MRFRLFAALTVASLSLATVTAVTDAEARPRRSGKQTRIAQTGGGASKSTNVQSLVLKAREMFDDQRYEESIQTLSGALVRPGSKPAERIEIYKLLAFNYITLAKSDEADSAARAIFVLDEAFELPKSESPRFREFFEKSKKAWVDEGKPGVEQTGGPVATTDKPISIKHAPPAAQVAPGSVVKLEGSIDDPEVRVTKVELYFRSGAKGKFSQKTLAFAMGAFRGEIPAASVVPPLLEYYVQAVDKGGLPVASRGDSEAPLRIAVPEETSLMWYEHPGFWVPVGLAVTAGVVLGAVFGTMSSGEAQQSTIRVSVRE
ncbi:MAG: hypothetical protein JNL21_16500 [Myxococcales bacterium]|nr:hypothetical protein [Myxococcales bacterium]